MSQKRGVLASQWTVPPPTVWGRSWIAPTWRGSVSLACQRYVRGSASGSGRPKPRAPLSSSLDHFVVGVAFVRSPNHESPFSKITTS